MDWTFCTYRESNSDHQARNLCIILPIFFRQVLIKRILFFLHLQYLETARSLLAELRYVCFHGDPVIERYIFLSVVILKECGTDILVEVELGIKTSSYTLFALAINPEYSPSRVMKSYLIRRIYTTVKRAMP
jgi:hypothetical protein